MTAIKEIKLCAQSSPTLCPWVPSRQTRWLNYVLCSRQLQVELFRWQVKAQLCGSQAVIASSDGWNGFKTLAWN